MDNDTRKILNALLQTLDDYVNSDALLYFKAKLDLKFATKKELENKVDKVSGKQLSTEDFTTQLKNKLDGLENYTLPKASSEVLGGVKVGAGLTIDGEGHLSATGGEADSVNWDNVVGKPTKLSEFENDSGFQTAENVESTITSKGYQTSSQVQQSINSAIAGITGVEYEVVESLPPSGKKGTIYLKSNGGSGQNIYDEYIWVNNKFEFIGTTQVDLSNYFNTTNFTPVSNEAIDAMFSS